MSNHAQENIASRERKIDLHSMTKEEVDVLSGRIGLKVGAALNDTAVKIKRMLSVYGLDFKMVYVIHELGQDPDLKEPEERSTMDIQPVEAPKAKKPRKKRAKVSDKITDNGS